MLAEQRFSEILSLVEQRGTVTVQELTEHLDTSESTIRRDLTALHEMGKLRKVFGGATSLEAATVTRDDVVTVRQSRNWEEKSHIVRYAASLIAPDDFVYLDAGTTTALLAEEIVPNGATYATNAVFHAKALAQKGCRVFLLGGEFKPVTEAVIGGRALEDLERYNFTKGFFGTNGISLTAGFSTPDDSEAMVKSAALRRCKSRYILADPSKFDVVSSVTFAGLPMGEIITTRVSNPAYREQCAVTEVDPG